MSFILGMVADIAMMRIIDIGSWSRGAQSSILEYLISILLERWLDFV